MESWLFYFLITLIGFFIIVFLISNINIMNYELFKIKIRDENFINGISFNFKYFWKREKYCEIKYSRIILLININKNIKTINTDI